MSDEPVERRRLQRDWLGHAIQATSIVAVLFIGLGAPMLYWSSGVNSSLAVLMDHDKSNSAAIAAAVTQEINASRDLSVLKEKVEEIRGSVKQATGRK